MGVPKIPAGIALVCIERFAGVDVGQAGLLEYRPANGFRRALLAALDAHEAGFAAREQGSGLVKGQGFACGSQAGFEGENDQVGIEGSWEHSVSGKIKTAEPG
jgi:hypothetical protein